MEIVIEVFAVYVHATLSNECAVHASIMGTIQDGKLQSVILYTFLLEAVLDDNVVITPNPR